jgi:uncharacterized protein RhaS with RHS repeats
VGLHYNYFRNYDSAVGRYVESDPLGQRAGTNTYRYADGAPVSRIDVLGLLSFDYVTPPRVYDPTLGANTLGATNALMEIPVCECIPCGSEWRLSSCSATLHILVSLRVSYGSRTKAVWARDMEQHHVRDVIDDLPKIREAGEKAERKAKAQSFSDQPLCELNAALSVHSAMQDAANVAIDRSRSRWDARGLHTYDNPGRAP